MILVLLQIMMVYVLYIFTACRGFKQYSNNKWDVTSVYGSNGKILRNYGYVDGFQTLNTSTKAVYVAQYLMH